MISTLFFHHAVAVTSDGRGAPSFLRTLYCMVKA